MKITKRRLFIAGLLIGALFLSIVTFLPGPIEVATAPVTRGPLQVSVDEEGETRAQERYTLAAPVAGRLERVTLRPGDAVARDQVVALLHIAPLDPRERATALARLKAAEALRREAEEMAARSQAEASQMTRERERAEGLQRQGYLPLQELEQARSAETAAKKAWEAARFKVQAAASEVEVARAALPAPEADPGDERRVLRLRAPAAGRVLRLLEESERVVPAGTPILVLGDPSRLEVVVPVLSTDAVRILPGMPVLVEGWGGGGALQAKVRTVEPGAFTKVSALGIEEQRVNVIAEFVDAGRRLKPQSPLDPQGPLDPKGPLGDGFRVEAGIVTWSADNVMKAPATALFHLREGWAVFVPDGGRARLRPVEIGHRTSTESEVLKGLAEGDRVILHPPNELGDGVRIRVR